MTGCTAWPTRTTVADSVLRERSVPPKRPSRTDWRYSGSPSRYLATTTQAMAPSLNYFFQRNRTQQYRQVGDAVPPLLASKIADIVCRILERKTSAVTDGTEAEVSL